LPRIKSAIKRVEVTERNRQRNLHYKSAFRNAIKKVLNAKANPEEAKEALKNAYSWIDRAVTKGVIHKNTASRYKARVARAVG
jgi:small subunit ribosomal protein S20